MSADYPDSARLFMAMAAEETGHHAELSELFRIKFGGTPPSVAAEQIQGIAQEHRSWLIKPSGPDAKRRRARQMEEDACRFYHRAASHVADPAVRTLLAQIAAAEAAHEQTAAELDPAAPPTRGRIEEVESGKKQFVLRIIQPGLVGLMDGSVSTLAPALAAVVAVCELLAIAWIQWRFMETPPMNAAAKVMLDGAVVLGVGVLIGST